MIDYKNKNILIVTKHKKEKVIAPVFTEKLNCLTIVTDNFDTDKFGTFSGEIARKDQAKETCINKAKAAAEQYNIDYAISSEGSFGPDPVVPFIPCNLEIMVFLDLKNNLTISEQLHSNEANYAHLDIDSSTLYDDFLQKIKFPSHGVMLKEMHTLQVIEKGIVERNTLDLLIQNQLKIHTSLRIETDMRAMYNPTRMKNIGILAEKLASRIIKNCPQCSNPGFGSIRPYGHLNCEWCGSKTKLYQLQQNFCEHCDYFENKPRPDAKVKAPPDYCDYCNP
jgi:ribosomal protein L37E